MSISMESLLGLSNAKMEVTPAHESHLSVSGFSLSALALRPKGKPTIYSNEHTNHDSFGFSVISAASVGFS